MTEDEAKTKMCPRTLAATVIAGEANFYPASCIGSACMAWRSHSAELENLIIAIKRHRTEFNSGLREAKEYVEAHPEYRRGHGPAIGWCGLAGRP